MHYPARRFVLVSLVSLASLASTGAFAAWRTVQGSGKIVTEHREATGLARVAVGGDFEVEIRQGSKEGIELTGDDNLLPLVETRLEGPADARVLRIETRDHIDWSSKQPIRIRIDLVTLSGIDLGGSGRVAAAGLHTKVLDVAIGGSGAVTLAGLEAERLGVSIGGSGRIGADGRAKAVAVRIGGSGDGDLGKLVADDVSVTIGGSGSATVNAVQTLKGVIAGSGRVRYSGAAVPSIKVAGSGSVDQI